MSSTITTYVWPALCFRTNMCISWISHPAVCLLGYKHMESLVWSLPFSHVVATAVLTRSGRASMAGILEKLCFSKTFIETLQKLHFQYLLFICMDRFGVSVSIQSTGRRLTNAETNDLISPQWVNLDLMSPPDYCCGHMVILIQQLFVMLDITRVTCALNLHLAVGSGQQYNLSTK